VHCQAVAAAVLMLYSEDQLPVWEVLKWQLVEYEICVVEGSQYARTWAREQRSITQQCSDSHDEEHLSLCNSDL
jgi:hypothetical protein